MSKDNFIHSTNINFNEGSKSSIRKDDIYFFESWGEGTRVFTIHSSDPISIKMSYEDLQKELLTQ